MEDNRNIKKKVISSLAWAFLERCGAQGVGLIVNIILARLLLPEDYGLLAIMVVFTSLANQFIQNGFSTSLIQNPDVEEEDYSSVFHVNLGITLLIYILLWFAAPAIGDFYNTDNFIWPFRVLSLVLFFGSVQSVQTAKLRREMDFKSIFYLTVSSSIAGGVLGILVAFAGKGVWALIVQQLMGSISTCVVLFIRLKWFPKAVINWKRVKILFSYGWKLLTASLLNALYNNLTGLIIGKKYSTTMLAYYDKGQMLPNKLISNIDDSIQNVMLSALSREQENQARCKQMMRRSMQTSCLFIFPMMAGMAAVAKPLVTILLTEKWLPCVPFMQLTCLIYASIPISTANLQAIKAMGRSDVYLKLEVIKKIMGIITLVIAVFCFESVFAIMLGTALTMPIGIFLNVFPNKKIVGYSFHEQISDIFPPLLLSIGMFIAVSAVGMCTLSAWVMLVLQILVGVLIYVGGSVLFKLESFYYIWNTIRPMIARILHS